MPTQVDRLHAQSQQMANDIQELKLSRLISPPKEQEAKLFWQRFCGLSQSSQQTVGQEEQLHKLLSMVADSNNKRNVYMILGTPGMVCYLCPYCFCAIVFVSTISAQAGSFTYIVHACLCL